jgi:glycosyltransferase involved in cell wall biosynthesis
MKAHHDYVSVIITTKNEEEVIESLLKSIINQTYKHIEIIVIDNNSKDKTVEIANQYTKHIYNKGPERSAQRNYGVKKASGSILLFLDADMVLTPKVVESCVELLIQKQKVAVIIPEKSIGYGYWSKCKILEREFYLGVPWIESARCFQRHVVEELGGYDERMSGPEDFDFPQRVVDTYGKNAIGRIRDFIIHNEGRLTLYSLLKKKYYYGLSMNSYVTKRHNVKKAIAQGNILLRYVLFLRKPSLLIRAPHISVGMIIMKTLELFSLFVGMINGKKFFK